MCVVLQDGSKLSKRHAAASAEYYIDAGFLPEAVVNFVAFLGWNPGTTQEVFTMDALVEAFSLPRIQKAGAVVNLAKMTWFNTQHVGLHMHGVRAAPRRRCALPDSDAFAAIAVVS